MRPCRIAGRRAVHDTLRPVAEPGMINIRSERSRVRPTDRHAAAAGFPAAEAELDTFFPLSTETLRQMTETAYTEGTRRALAQATELAVRWQDGLVRPEHLLRALLDDESQASERLREAGVTTEIARAAGLFEGRSMATSPACAVEPGGLNDPVEAATRDVAAALGQNPATDQPQQSEEFQAVLLRARVLASAEGRGVEVSTEHLLAGLVDTDSSASRLLARHGLCSDADHLAARILDAAAQPMSVEFQLECDTDVSGDRLAACRILDAAANRAREGLRVVEDYVRFALDDAHLSELLKRTRHQLADALRQLDPLLLVSGRDTAGDVGTVIHTPSEMARTTPLAVAQASLKRAQEAARTLEEYSKLVSPAVPPDQLSVPERLGRFRYGLYTLEKAVLTTAHSRRQLDDFRLYLLLTEGLCRLDVETVLSEAVRNGVRIVQIREKTLPDRALLEWAHRVRAATRTLGVKLIINDRPDLAVLCDADGVHVGQEELSVRDARRVVGPERLVGVSTHNIEQARQAVLDGASYLGVGPVFPSGTKAFAAEELAGLDFVRQVAGEISLPWYAIGGIDAENLKQVLDAGATRVAVSGAVCRSGEPGRAAAGLVATLATR